MTRFFRHVALAVLLLAPAARASALRDDCVPMPILAAIAHGSGVRVVQLGEVREGDAVRHDDPPGSFLGRRRLAAYAVRGAAAEALRETFGRRGRYDCGAGPRGLDFGGGREGALGIEFDTPRGPVRVLLGLPGGTGRIGFASGVRYDFALTAEAHRDWGRFLEAFASSRHSRPADFLEAMLDPQSPESPTPAPYPPAVDSLLCSEDEAKEVAARIREECPDPLRSLPEPFADDWPELPGIVTRVAADYPEEARRAGLQGTVYVQALVGCDGRVWCMRLQKSVPGLDEAALRAVRQWVFTPMKSNGRAVIAWVAVPVKFSLH